jgi:GTP-binding protein HflX
VVKEPQFAPHETLVERAYLVGVSLPNSSIAKENEHLDELAQLAMTAGAVVVGRTVQGRTRIDGTTFIGSGKVNELKEEFEKLDVNLAIFDSDLSPGQARNLEKILEINVIDRTELILDIFARHARTQQSKTQVELAQLNYALPRLKRLWDHLSRQQGGIGTRGPGETQLEVDRRRIHERIARLKRELSKFQQRKDVLRQSREGMPVVAIVGYTNTGKSTLMNAMTGADTLAENQLFATLDTLTRKMESNNNTSILLVDTVGFIRKLPHHLVESFKVTLGDIARADLWLHIIDASHPAFDEQMVVADRTLDSIRDTAVETLYVFNKIDQVDSEILIGLERRYPDAVFISAKTRNGLDVLEEKINEKLLGKVLRVEVRVPATDGKTIAKIKSLLKDPEDAMEDGYYVVAGTIESNSTDELERISGVTIRYLL